MSIHTTYTHARERFASFINEVTENREIVIISRRGREDVAMIAASELSSILETAHLLRSSANAERLRTALARLDEETPSYQTLEELWEEVGLD